MDATSLQADVDRLGSFAAVAREHGISSSTIRSRAERLGVNSPSARSATANTIDDTTPGVQINGDTATITLKPGTPFQPEQLLRDHGLDADEWIVTNARPNSWQALAPEGEIVTLHQLKVEAVRRIPKDMWLPARTDAPLRKPPRARRATKTKPLLIALPADQHCPHQDPGLEACWLEWVRANQPGKIIGAGDLLNLSKPHAKHRANLHERHNDTPKECFQTGHDWWRNTLEAAGPNCVAEQIAGNHDARAAIACIERMPEMYDVCRPGEEHPWHDLEYLLGLDKLGIKYHRPTGEYHSVEVFLAENFSMAHGAKAGPHGGAPRDAAKHEGSRAVGHAHKASITVIVRYRNGHAIQHVHVSIPTMARRDLGYTDKPDTHQGFATLTLHTGGTWNAELALYDDRRQQLWWRDQVYYAASL